MRVARFFALSLWLLLPLCVAQAADIPGSKDPAFLKRYQGSEIVAYSTRSFDSYALPVPDLSNPKTPGKLTSDNREGAITRIFYRVPAGHTALEVLRNYEQAVKEAGIQIAYELLPCKEDWPRPNTDLIIGLVKGAGVGLQDNPFNDRSIDAPPNGSFCFFTAAGAKNGQDIGLTIGVEEERNAHRLQYNIPGAPPIKLTLGDILVMVDVVATKALENKMVEVKAADMADALASKGFVDLYGIYFATDKTDITPDSTKMLDEVANLLKIDRSLKLEISGHTDNTGDKAHNQKLSEGRAAAVVRVLTTKYGINASRLQAKGYGDTKPVAPNDTDANKAKNRRVELRKV